MNRFQKHQTVRELIDHIIVLLEEDGYNQIPDCTGGDQDFFNDRYIKKGIYLV